MKDRPPSYHTSRARSNDSALPSVDRCILHLRLLTAFARLRDTVRQHDGLFGCRDSDKVSKADLRWTIFVAMAVQRFETRHVTLLEMASCSEPLDDSTRPNKLLDRAADLLKRSEVPWDEQYGLPLDGLLVLHSHMLNPRDFLQDCVRHRLLSVWEARFPWEWVERYLDTDKFLYELPKQVIDSFGGLCTGKQDGGDDCAASIKCPGCSLSTSVPWIELYSGYNDQSEKGNIHVPFQVQCSACGQSILPETLALAQLRDDLKELQDNCVPLPGTVLTKDGIPEEHIRDDSVLRPQPETLNDLLRSKFGKELLQKLTDDLSNQTPMFSLDNFQEKVETRTANSDEASQAIMMTALKKMMAKYRHNASPFALDLVGAVLRQGTFITKMQDFDWIRSPALRHTVSQAVARYTGFFEVMSSFPNNVAVPTFDVDLVWHTHQLSPPEYFIYSIRHCNDVFIDHDDKIGDGVLGNSFEWTCEAFRKLTGEQYDKCLCWSCEVLEEAAMNPSLPRSELSSSLTSRIKNKIKKPETRYEPSPAEIEVIRIQLMKFESDYAKLTATPAGIGAATTPSKLDYFHTYNWHHPTLAPLPQELKL